MSAWRTSLKLSLVIAALRQCTAGVPFTKVLDTSVYRLCAVAVVRRFVMREFMSDWRKWTPAERALAIAILASMMAVPVGMLLGITSPV
jgi:hypothetical protein